MHCLEASPSASLKRGPFKTMFEIDILLLLGYSLDFFFWRGGGGGVVVVRVGGGGV